MATDNQENEIVGKLEKINPNLLTLQALEDAYEQCMGSQIALVFLADILFRAVSTDLEEFCTEVENLQDSLSMEEEAGLQDKDSENVREQGPIGEDVYITIIVEWVDGGVHVVPRPNGPSILSSFLPIAYALARAYANPCNDMAAGVDSILSCQELQAAASSFMKIRRPRIADALPIIRCLRKKPVLDCARSSRADSEKLAKFDRKWERLCSLYPVVNVLADPALVVIETLGGGGPPPQVAAVIAAITSARNNPLPSVGGAPVLFADVVGNFSHIFQLPNIHDARAFAAMLRVQLADATGGGGLGPTTRIVALNAPPGSLRLY